MAVNGDSRGAGSRLFSSALQLHVRRIFPAACCWPRVQSNMHQSGKQQQHAPTCWRSASVKPGRPQGTSPFHWKHSASSPASPTCKIVENTEAKLSENAEGDWLACTAKRSSTYKAGGEIEQ